MGRHAIKRNASNEEAKQKQDEPRYDLFISLPSHPHYDSSEAKIHWNVGVGNQIALGDILATVEGLIPIIDNYKSITKKETINLLSHMDGRIISISDMETIKSDIENQRGRRNGENIEVRMGVAFGCAHEATYKNMCLKCNKDLSHLTQQQQVLLGNKVSMLHKDHRFKINQKEGELIAEEEQKRLLDVEKKLVLVLDIDHTLLHATGDPLAVSAFDIVRKKGVHLNSFCQIEGKDDRYGFTWCHILKLRPYLREFLEEASRICELHIFTHGNRIYADKVAKVLDPTGKLFGERVISRDEMEISSPENSRKTLKHIFPADDRAVMIIDDSIKVWAGHESNLFEIIPYIPWEIYFGISKDVNNRLGSKFPQAQNSQLLPLNLFVNKMIEIDRKEHDNQLKAILDKLHYIHTKFFERYKRGENVHVKDLIVESKGSILKGTNILFSGVIPLGSNPSNERIWRLAERMGANCYIEWSENVSITHLIAKSRDPNNLTEKIRRAEKTPGVFIVHHSWVEQCYRFSDHFNEFDFLLYRSHCSLPLSRFYPACEATIHEFQASARELMLITQQVQSQISHGTGQMESKKLVTDHAPQSPIANGNNVISTEEDSNVDSVLEEDEEEFMQMLDHKVFD